VNDSGHLERRYRHLLACYPRTFRREHEEEILGVLLAGATDGRSRPGWGECADLITSAMWMRVRPGAPAQCRSVSVTVRLMYLGALVELCTLVTVMATLGSLKSAILQRDPGYSAAQWQAEMSGHIVPLEIEAIVATGIWLGLARARRRGHGWTRFGFAGFFAVITVGLMTGIAQHAATYARADLVAGAVLWLVALVTVVFMFRRSSASHDRPASTGA
jgi:hypothetical protein